MCILNSNNFCVHHSRRSNLALNSGRKRLICATLLNLSSVHMVDGTIVCIVDVLTATSKMDSGTIVAQKNLDNAVWSTLRSRLRTWGQRNCSFHMDPSLCSDI